MLDLNDLRVFERVGSLLSFAGAARALSQPRSTISRSVARLEAELGTRLIQRNTREVALTQAGESLMARCTTALAALEEAVTHVAGSAATPRGVLRVSAGIGVGINVLAEQLPHFMRLYPEIDIRLDLTSRTADLVNDSVDVAIRMGPLPDSSLVSVRLGEMRRVLCGSPDYLERCGVPKTVQDLSKHDVIEMPGSDGRARSWSLSRGTDTEEVRIEPRVHVNDALTIHRLILNGAGIGIVSCYLCAPEISAGRMVHLLPEWTAPPIGIAIVFPSKRELSPVVRSFVEFMKAANPPGLHWLNNTLAG